MGNFEQVMTPTIGAGTNVDSLSSNAGSTALHWGSLGAIVLGSVSIALSVLYLFMSVFKSQEKGKHFSRFVIYIAVGGLLLLGQAFINYLIGTGKNVASSAGVN